VKPFPDVTPGTTIESAVHNGTVADVETDLNAPRPVIAGGTGATSAAGARTNLKTEVAAQTVTNYDSHVFENGSFWSASTATGEPVDGETFAGTAVILNNDPNSIVLHATSQNNGASYTRVKLGGVWGAWTREGIDDYVNVTGDLMTGDLRIRKNSAFLYLEKAVGTASAVGVQAGVFDGTNYAARWSLQLADSTAESTPGSNVGSNFSVIRCTDGGTLIDSPLTINRANGSMNVKGLTATSVTSTSSVSGVSAAFGATALTGALTGTTAAFTGNVSGAAGTFTGNVSGATGSFTGNVTATGMFEATTSAYGFRVVHPGRTWGVGVTTSPVPGLSFDDVTGTKVAAVFTQFSTYCTLILPNMTTTAVAPNCAVSASTGTFIFSSSRRYKKDIEPLSPTDADKLLLLDAVTYKSTSVVDDPDRTWYGFVAEDVDRADPRLVYREYKREDLLDERDGKTGEIKRRVREGAIKVPDQVDYTRITVLAVAKVQEQEKRIKAQEERIAGLIARLEALEAT